MGTHLKKTPRLSSVFSLHASFFSRFEDDVWIEIAKYLDGRSLVMLATICKWFYNTLLAECVWKYASLRDLAVPDPGDVSFIWKKLYVSAFDGSHSCLFRQQDKHIDACCMIDRRMGIWPYGCPSEVQALFFFALRCAKNMLKEVPENKELLDKINSKIKALSYHIRTYNWLDYTQLNNIYRDKTEEYSHTALNKFNLSPESFPDWLFEFMPLRGGYFIGNVSPARMDFRWFLLGNCIAILSSLATPKQASAILDLIEACWDELVGEMPLKIFYPALEGYDRNIITGFDSKNTRWSYHNGGSWPVLLWLLVSSCIKTARPQMAGYAIELVEKHLSNDGWPEYYDGKTGRYIGKQARILQFEDDVWTEIAKYLDGRSLVMLPTTCKWFYKTLSEECMWKYACLCDLAVPDPGDVSFNWKKLCASAFGGSHSYLFGQQEKHIDWIRIGAFFLESSAAIVTEKLTSPPRKIHLKDTLEQMLQSCGLCVLTNVKFHVMSSSLETVESTTYRGDRSEGNGDDDGDDDGDDNDDGGDGGEEGQGESPEGEEGDEGDEVIGGPEEKKGDGLIGVYWRLKENDKDITLITNLEHRFCCYQLGDTEGLFDHVKLKVAEVNHPAVPRYYKIVLETRTNKSSEFSEMFTEYPDISRNLHRVIICPNHELTIPLLL